VIDGQLAAILFREREMTSIFRTAPWLIRHRTLLDHVHMKLAIVLCPGLAVAERTAGSLFGPTPKLLIDHEQDRATGSTDGRIAVVLMCQPAGNIYRSKRGRIRPVRLR
jgi:hypothetical protein